jgi:hypothetical protein
MNGSAAVSQTSRSKFECAAAGFQHSRAPFRGSMHEFFGVILTPPLPWEVKLCRILESLCFFCSIQRSHRPALTPAHCGTMRKYCCGWFIFTVYGGVMNGSKRFWYGPHGFGALCNLYPGSQFRVRAFPCWV